MKYESVANATLITLLLSLSHICSFLIVSCKPQLILPCISTRNSQKLRFSMNLQFLTICWNKYAVTFEDVNANILAKHHSTAIDAKKHFEGSITTLKLGHSLDPFCIDKHSLTLEILATAQKFIGASWFILQLPHGLARFR